MPLFGCLGLGLLPFFKGPLSETENVKTSKIFESFYKVA